jgi:hypothetical protein
MKDEKVNSNMNKKPKIKRTNLLNPDDIWNAVISVLTEYDYSTENKVAYEAFTVFQYYNCHLHTLCCGGK